MTGVNTVNPLDFPLHGTRLIEASAGTGKTYTIAALYVRLILGATDNSSLPERDLLPPDILVVTFTDAATKELRERIRARLTQAAAYFRQQSTASDEFLTELRTRYKPDLWPACARRLELAANWMDEAAVYTIHGWCNRMLQQHAFDSGSLFRQEVDNNDTELLNETVRDYWRTFFYPLTETQCQAVFKLARSPDDLIRLLKPLLTETEAQGLACVDDDLAAVFNRWELWELQRQDLDNQARRLWSGDQMTIEALLNKASQEGWLNGNLYRKAGFTGKLAELDAWAQHGYTLAIDALAKFGRQKLAAGLVKAHQQADPLQHAAFEAIDRLVIHTEQEEDIAEKLTLHAIHWIRNRYDSEKQRIASMTFDDMLTRLDKALSGLNGERLKSVILQQYPIALIDEFQDTDPVQYRIFARVYSDETGLGCFMIGDPKQAIYSFRGGDIYTYLKAHHATAGKHYTLGTNYRSTKALVDAVNQVFVFADQQEEGAFRFKNGEVNPLPFIPVTAKGRDDTWQINGQAAVPALTLWHWESSEGIGLPVYRTQMAEVTASEIVRLLNSAQPMQTGFKATSGPLRPVQPADIAILVRTGMEAKIMRAALARRQLRSVYLSERDSIYDSREAADLLIWLKAMAEPRNERKVRAALSTATLDWSYQTLHQLTLDEPAWEIQLERFLGYQLRWQQDGILPTIRQLLSDYAVHARLSENNEGERCITNLLHLAELLQQASGQLEGEQALIRHLAEAIADRENANGSEESVIRLESDANLIKIITIHKSKGLEYPLVFLPFICSFREINSQRTRYYRFHDEHQALTIDLSKRDENKLLNEKERLQEDLRLLYVAITRAQYACWLGIAPVKTGNTKNCQLEKSAIGYLLGWQAKMAAGELGQQLGLLKGDCKAITIEVLPEPNPDLYQPLQQPPVTQSPRTSTAPIADNWWIASYSALKTEDQGFIQSEGYTPEAPENFLDDKQSDEADRPSDLSMTVQGIHSLPRGAGPGVLIHELMEQCAQQGFQNVHADEQLRKQLIESIFHHNDWIDQHDLISEGLSHWLTLPLLKDQVISLASLSKGHYQAEPEFLIGADAVNIQALDHLVTRHTFGGKPRPRLLPNHLNGLLKGFIDLLFEHQGHYYVIDYKFNALGNNDEAYTLEAMESAMLAKRYDLQYALYLLALHRLLKTRMGERYDYDQHLGGGLYLFLRGSQHPSGGRMFEKPPEILIDGMDKLFSGTDRQGAGS
ncbi:MAG: exodeoxyribonuclease V subunit beta [Methylicorpusculum sp.]|uniref:exodeoxyribonuclease V subunit beta n=1 Tax=Methylicorpusculum sp. TaxID=2713644 RepID=UPI00271EB8E7|nr:exodeoxyribonuclease V subunit beta [Methylicorpusculum sp.]MDO8939038.1 exodeoxyribonuclease V subunit beta [Methylicorpusculum sp.]MDP2202945.1 exodeoxyribonuclease V subunit beta [Methylicorpusculum sp.]